MHEHNIDPHVKAPKKKKRRRLTRCVGDDHTETETEPSSVFISGSWMLVSELVLPLTPLMWPPPLLELHWRSLAMSETQRMSWTSTAAATLKANSHLSSLIGFTKAQEGEGGRIGLAMVTDIFGIRICICKAWSKEPHKVFGWSIVSCNGRGEQPFIWRLASL